MFSRNGLNNAEITILFVEDESATREQVSRILGTRGYKLILAENGRQGLDAYLEKRPDIVLTDIMMPEMSGLEMASAIRDVSIDSQIICMTAFSDTSYLIKAIDIGINQFVLKPVEFSRLLAALERCQEVIELKKRHLKLEAENLRARKMEAIGILAGGMAHDFNNLLQIILGYVSLARMNVEPSGRAAELLATAEKSSETARDLGRRLLTFARGGESHFQITDIKPIIEAVIREESTVYGFRCVLNLGDTLPLLRIDVAQVGQVITHLTINAREAMPKGGLLTITALTLNVSVDEIPALEPGEYLHLAFEDTGSGILPENMPRIFDPYFTTKEMGTQKGMGLGLALCHSIIRRHRGQIIAESEPGEGTIIHLYLPVIPPKADASCQDE